MQAQDKILTSSAKTLDQQNRPCSTRSTTAPRKQPGSCIQLAPLDPVSQPRFTYWREMGIKIQLAFFAPFSREANLAGSDVLEHFISLFLDHFHTLWPLFRQRDFDANNLFSALYLILTATGAMYSGAGGRL